MSYDVKKGLQRTKELVLNGWTQKALARDKDGEIVSPFGYDAVCWCLGGALLNVGWDNAMKMSHVIYEVGRKHGLIDLVSWNDHEDTNLEKVILLLDDAIANCE